jgi:hypothetical protein
MMSPRDRRGRLYGSSEESRLRDLSPDTTLRAFTQKPMPFDTTRDEYKIFSCIETLTAAERDLGTRVAKAAQRLKTWCAEIEQWGWSGSFEQPSAEYREQRRRSIEMRIREHVAESDVDEALAPLDYWGSLLSVEVEQHEARLDDMEDEMLKLDIEELKEHVLDMHPTGRSRPSSAGYEADRQHYKIMDDFSFLITQTLLSALPHHAQLKDRLSTWIARVSILREAPRYMGDLDAAQKAMRLGWDAIEPPTDTSDLAFEQWKKAVDTISRVLQNRVSDLGKRLDRMLDTLEGRDDCLPEIWIDNFERTEADYGQWTHESRRRVIDLDVRRREEGFNITRKGVTEMQEPHSSDTLKYTSIDGSSSTPAGISEIHVELRANATAHWKSAIGTNEVAEADKSEISGTARAGLRSATSFKTDVHNTRIDSAGSAVEVVSPEAGSATDPEDDVRLSGHEHATSTKNDIFSDDKSPDVSIGSSASSTTLALPRTGDGAQNDAAKIAQFLATASSSDFNTAYPMTSVLPEMMSFESEALPIDDESEFDEGDTVVHNELDDDLEDDATAYMRSESISQNDRVDDQLASALPNRPRPLAFSDAPIITANDGQDSAIMDPPHTPRSWRGSLGSFSTDMSPDSSPHSTIEESPSVRNATNRSMRAPRPELNAAMAKRRAVVHTIDDSSSAPWPPSRFSEKTHSSADDLERKISDILNTIPAHIRLRSGPGPDAPEVKSARGLRAKGSRGYLRAARSASGLKSPELTLSPAKSEFESNNTATGRSSRVARGDNDIKLYHLTQLGKEQPIKLFIRRVGENGERLMVRVGGGWSDLGEFLRQYAEHHGRRTASEGKFEILGMEVKNNDGSPQRPDTAMSSKRHSLGHTLASPVTTPSKPSGVGISKDEAPPPMPKLVSTTPGIAEETADPSSASSRLSWSGNEVGLAGPKARKLDLSGEKLEWIEGMMKQARTVSGNFITPHPMPSERGESASDFRPGSGAGTRPAVGGRKSDFGDLGKVGNTKRVFMKGGKPTFGEH